MEPGKKYLDIFKEKINKALNNNDKVYSDFIDIPVDSIINKLINNKTLTNDDKYKIENILYNFGFEIPANSSEPDVQKYFREKFQYTNPTHRGILLGLLLNEKNNLLEPFIPLQNFPEEDRKVLKITKNWQKDLVNVLKKTEKSKWFGGRSRHRTRHRNDGRRNVYTKKNKKQKRKTRKMK
jgi:hypothetical protein